MKRHFDAFSNEFQSRLEFLDREKTFIEGFPS